MGNVPLPDITKHEAGFQNERNYWINKIITEHPGISDARAKHLRDHNKKLNLAIRVVEPFGKEAPIWTLNKERQLSPLVDAVNRMKPLIDFFVK